MKAAQITAYGHADVVKITDVQKPTAGPDQVLIEVYASSLNPFDSSLREGKMQQFMPLQFPTTLGGDVVGIVAEVGEGVTNVAVGDTVYGSAGGTGAFAEYAIAPQKMIAKAPTTIDWAHMATLPLVAVSALQALYEHIHLQSGQKILLHGGAGNIGVIAIQLAKHIGAYVTVTATGNGLALAKQLGADEVIDFASQDFTAILKDYDAVYNMVGGDEFNKSLRVLKRGGIGVTMLNPADQTKAQELGVTTIAQQTHITTAALDTIRQLVEDGVITPQVGKVFPLDQIKEAFELREAGQTTGKIVISIK